MPITNCLPPVFVFSSALHTVAAQYFEKCLSKSPPP